jgi:hypothetical protein
MEAYLPAFWPQTEIRQKSALDACSKRKIILESTLFGAGKVVEAELHQRIGQQPFRFNGVMASLAKPECPSVDTTQRVIDSSQQLLQ